MHGDNEDFPSILIYKGCKDAESRGRICSCQAKRRACVIIERMTNDTSKKNNRVDLTLKVGNSVHYVEVKTWSRESVSTLRKLIRENARLIQEEQRDNAPTR